MRSLRLVGFALVWLVAETVALFMLAGLWVVSGFGGRLRTAPYQSRHYAVMRWFLAWQRPTNSFAGSSSFRWENSRRWANA